MYSLRDFVPADVPYEELAELIGYAKNYGFPGHLVLEGNKARAATTTLYRREEQPLVTEFCATLAITVERFRSPVGLCDIYIQGTESVEMIEAKSRTEHAYVREALAQLLDYAPHSPRPVDRLAVLLPDSPDERELQLLHRYGVDCIHRVSPGVFRRVPAPDDRRHLMKRLWTES